MLLVDHTHSQVQAQLRLERFRREHLAVIEQAVAQQALKPAQPFLHLRLVNLILHHLDQEQLIDLFGGASQ